MATNTKRIEKTQETPLGGKSAGPSQRGPAATRSDQRSRLLEAIVEIVSRDGYPDAKIGDLAERAGVSRATFYELFDTKEGCLLAAQHELADELNDELELAVAQGEPARAAQSALSALVAFADREPREFDFLMHEAMLAGPQAVQERDRLMTRFEQTIERSWTQAPKDAPVMGMSAKILLAGGVRLVSLRMRRDGDPPKGLLPDLLAWVDSYTVAAERARWRELTLRPAPPSTRPERSATLPPQRSLPKGRHRIGAEAVKRVQRERIAYATAEAIRQKGYANITVADIVSTAGLSRDAFYTHFRDRQEAFEEAIQLTFERLLATMAGAFFGSSGSWPEQVWEAGLAFGRFIEGDPALANFLFVGTYAPPMYIGRVHDFVLAFTVFVEHGNRFDPQTEDVPRIVSEAIVCSVLEAVTFHVRHNRVRELWSLIPLIAYMVFAPFMGTEKASDFVEAKIADT
jgi:AcrR family transcriptional regulator